MGEISRAGGAKGSQGCWQRGGVTVPLFCAAEGAESGMLIDHLRQRDSGRRQPLRCWRCHDQIQLAECLKPRRHFAANDRLKGKLNIQRNKYAKSAQLICVLLTPISDKTKDPDIKSRLQHPKSCSSVMLSR